MWEETNNDTLADNVSVQLLCGEASILVNWSEHPTVRSSVTFPWLRKSFDLGVTQWYDSVNQLYSSVTNRECKNWNISSIRYFFLMTKIY